MLVSLGDMYSTQSKSYEQTYKDLVWLLNYSASHPIAIIHYKESYMILQIHFDASYLSDSRSRSLAGGHQYLGNTVDDPPNNESINIIFNIVMNVMGLVAESEIGSTYTISQYSVPLIICLIENGHPQPPAKLQIYSNTTEAFSKVTLNQNI